MRLCLISFLLAVHFLTNLNAQEADTGELVAAQVKLIPPEDRKILLRFFQRLFYHGDFSYTMLGQKPTGSIDYNLNLLAFPQFYKEPQNHLYLMALDEKGWEKKFARTKFLQCFVRANSVTIIPMQLLWLFTTKL